MDISARLKKVVDMVPGGKCWADIGTDHGYVLLALLEKGKIEKGIAVDNKKKPLEKARLNARLEGKEDQLSFRLGSGFEPLKPKEAEGAILAGIGGILIKELLEHSMDVVQEMDHLLLLPAQNPEILRAYLYEQDFEILDEELLLEDRRFYEYFLVRKGKGEIETQEKICEYSIGEILVRKKHPLLEVFIEDMIQNQEKILGKIQGDTDNVKFKQQVLQNKINELRRVVDERLR